MRAICVALLGLFLFSFTGCTDPMPSREERITAVMLHVDEVPSEWHLSTDVSLSAKPACNGISYWRTFRPNGGMGRFQLVQQVVFDCADTTESDHVFRILTLPMLRVARAPKALLGGHPNHADDFAAYCEYNLSGGTECKIISRYGAVVSQIFSIQPTGINEWPSERELLDWGVVRMDEALRNLH